MPLTSEDYGFKRSEIAPGEVELRWQPESWGAASWAALGIAVFGLSFPVLAYAPFLLPLVPLGFWMLKRRIHRAKTLRLTPHYLVVGDSRWSRDELSEIAVDQSSQPTGRERGLRRALRDEQARTSHRVVLYRGSKPIVVARDLSLRRAEYLSEVLTEWARAGHDDAAANA